MSRIRSVHPGLYTDEAWASVSVAARWLAVGLMTEADDNGVFEWKPLQLKMRIFPADNIDLVDLLAELERSEIIRKFRAENRLLGAIRNFCRYQKPRKPKAWFPTIQEIRQFIALEGDDDALDEDDLFATRSELGKLEGDQVPQKSEFAPQMEEGGGRMEDGGGNLTPTPFKPPEPEWSEFVKFRQRIRAPLTDHAKKLAARELEKLVALGHDPAKVLERSILNGWKGLFPLKDDHNGNARSGNGSNDSNSFERALRHIERGEGRPSDRARPDDR